MFIFVFQDSQNSFSCDLPFGPFWSVKYLNFGQKLPIRSAYHTFLESRHPEATRKSYYVLSIEGSQKKISAHGLWEKRIDHSISTKTVQIVKKKEYLSKVIRRLEFCGLF